MTTKKDIPFREVISERIEFMADHWTTDDKKPYDFGGWKEEVVDQIMKAIRERMPAKSGARYSNPEGIAYAGGRNKAIDEIKENLDL